MSQIPLSSKTIFRACVVNAVRGGEALMGELVKVTQGALTSEESNNRDISKRNLISDSLRLLNQHEAALVKGYSMALLEIFAEGPALAKGRAAQETGMDFGELSLLDESEVQAQVELSKAQQSALHATDAVLAELNGLVSAAQGLRSVQPERNPLRPESYIRALQQVVGETGVSADIRQLWMQQMRDLLGKLLVGEYKRTVASLREHGVQPVGYAVLGGSSGPAGRGGAGTGYGRVDPGTDYGNPGTGYGSGYSGYGHSVNAPMGEGGGYGPTSYGRGAMPQSTGWRGESQQAPMTPSAEEALLTVGILRQMLAGGDPFDPRGYGAMPMMPGQPMGGRSGWADPRGGTSSAQSGFGGGVHHSSGAVAEAMEDMAQLERLVGRLANTGSQSGSLQAPLVGWRNPAGVAPVLYATMPMDAALESTTMAVEVVGRMMDNIAQDSRLLASVQQAVKRLEPTLKQLVQHDARFFTDATHPARRLLDELTHRSLAFADETAPGFSRFMRLVNEAVGHLAANKVKDAGPFASVLKALQSAWEDQEKNSTAQAQAQAQADQQALLQAEQREMLAEQIAADIRKLSDNEQVPADILNFAAGPWSDVIALAQVSSDGQQDDPGGYLALVPVLLWSAQPELTRQEPERLTEAIPSLLVKLRKGLKTIQYPAVQTSGLLQRLVSLHQAAFEKPVAATLQEASPESVSVAHDLASDADVAAQPLPSSLASEHSAQVPVEGPDPYADFVVGAWVDLVTNGRVVHTQLTWSSPQGTLFLFTALDASTQSMTRRMRNKLVSESLLRVVPARPAPARAPQTAGKSLTAKTALRGPGSSRTL